MQRKFTEKVALITGAGSGLGEAAARLLAREGAKVVLVSRTLSEIKLLARKINQDGGEAMAVAADVGHAPQMENVIKRIRRKWKRLDIVFANAGINGVWSPLEKLTIDEWDETMRINLRGTFLTVKLALPLLEIRGGSVIVTSSVNGNRMFSNIGASAYATTKAGQTALAKMLAVELGHKRIRVNVICPGAIETEINDNTNHRAVEETTPRVVFPDGQIPLTGHRSGSAAQVAQLVSFLASDQSDHISGTEIYIDGAQSLLQG
jgi:NAD(P)-dependent dehydrogenase (short-subunit alcohol dehydrogenase family)